jgi:lysyl-tRNA synthetase class II
MKRLIVFAALFALLAASPALACGDDKAKSEMAWKQVKPQMEKLDNGVRLVFASTDGAMIEHIKTAATSGKILSCEGQCPMKTKTIQRQVKVEDGRVILTATSELPEMASYLQKQATKLSDARKADAQTAAKRS